jgi:hypothetical protein
MEYIKSLALKAVKQTNTGGTRVFNLRWQSLKFLIDLSIYRPLTGFVIVDECMC